MHKKKWCDGVYFMAQDLCMEDTALRPNRAVHRLAIMGFVRTTCVRAGSMAKDWFDRAGLAARSALRSPIPTDGSSDDLRVDGLRI